MPMPRRFAVTWDYRCPFARNAHEHLLDALDAGADWDVRFVPFSLGQVHVTEGAPSVWDEPDQDSGIVALQAGTVVRDEHPEQFADVHRRLFASRHDAGLKLRDPDVVAKVLADAGLDAEAVLARVADGSALATVRAEHERAAEGHTVWGVPTFISGDRAVFVRLMDRPAGNGPHAVRTVERVLDLLDGWPELNEFKHTSIPR